MSHDWQEAARFLIRCALEEEACWTRLHEIVDEEKDRIWPQYSEERRRVRVGVAVYSGPVAQRLRRVA